MDQIQGAVYKPPNVERLTDRFSHVSVDQGYYHAFGGSNIRPTNNGSTADLILDKSSGSGLVSKNKYYYGFFSAAIKLPPGFTSGVVIAFYLSNADVYPHNHDEIDFELLGHEKRREWVLQTNVYGNGSVKTGREEKFYLWFDPTMQFHQYSILWNNHHTVFLVDNIPVRQVIHNNAIGSAYPSKPMSVYSTIWDGSEWATRGGKYPVNYKFAPFVASFGAMEMEGCIMHEKNSTTLCSKSGLSSLDPIEGQDFTKLSEQQITGLKWARGRRMFYSYCKDTSRYKVLPPECNAK
jgi:xyloglucan:xyloglucosyl transferase